MDKIKIVGIIQANNEWPLLLVSISHALIHHVDEVFLLNHSHHDNYDTGLYELKRLWGDRVHIFNYVDHNFFQEAATNALIEISQKSLPDWIWVFDADEFLLTPQCLSLANMLKNVSSDYIAVRYEVKNWVSNADFDPAHLDHYLTLCNRSLTSELLTCLPSPILSDEIYHGNMNYFDVPFQSKVIFRSHSLSWLCAGAHGLKYTNNPLYLEIKVDQLQAAHFPLLSKERLFLKAKQGEKLIASGFSVDHGWQSQLIYSLLKEDKLDQFWKAHSVGLNDDVHGHVLPSVEKNSNFIESIRPIITFLKNELGATIKNKYHPNEISNTTVPIEVMISFSRKAQGMIDSLSEALEKAREETKNIRFEIDVLKNDPLIMRIAWIRNLLYHIKKTKIGAYFINKLKQILL